MGVAKVVVDSSTSADAFTSATGTLALAVSSVCQESYASVLWEELRALRRRVSGFQQLESAGARRAAGVTKQTVSADEEGGAVESEAIVSRALDHLHQSFTNPDLSLGAIAGVLGCNPNYLTQRFTQVVGQHMHGYIVALRVDRACRELLGTVLAIKQIAPDSGFRDASGMSRAFRRHVGVSPSEYRRIFGRR